MYSHACLLPDSNAVAVGPLVISEANYFSLQPKGMEKEIASQGIICFHLDSVFLSAHITVLSVCFESILEMSTSWVVWGFFFIFLSTKRDLTAEMCVWPGICGCAFVCRSTGCRGWRVEILTSCVRVSKAPLLLVVLLIENRGKLFLPLNVF